MVKAYISGAVSCLSEDVWMKNFNDAENFLKTTFKGYEVINPTALEPYKGQKTWQGYMRSDISALALCDEIWVMRNWLRSRGAIVEIIIAKILGIKVRRLNIGE